MALFRETSTVRDVFSDLLPRSLSCPDLIYFVVIGVEDYDQLVQTMDEVFAELNHLCKDGMAFDGEQIYIDW